MDEITIFLLYSITSLVLIITAAIVLIIATKPRREETETKTPQPQLQSQPVQTINTPVKLVSHTLTQPEEDREEAKTLKIELEIPLDIPRKIRVEPEKALEIIKMLRERGVEEESLNHKFVVQEKEREEKREEPMSWSSFKRHDNPLLDIIEKVSGLEFSDDGNRVYCPRHGWVPYVVTSAGDILCGEGHEILWSPNKPVIDKNEIIEIRKGLQKLYSEVEELQRQAMMEQPHSREEEEERVGEVEEEEYGEE